MLGVYKIEQGLKTRLFPPVTRSVSNMLVGNQRSQAGSYVRIRADRPYSSSMAMIVTP